MNPRFEVAAEPARAAILALSELRGWAIECPKNERDWMLVRIDRCLDAFGLKEVVQRAHGEVLEGISEVEAA